MENDAGVAGSQGLVGKFSNPTKSSSSQLPALCSHRLLSPSPFSRRPLPLPSRCPLISRHRCLRRIRHQRSSPDTGKPRSLSLSLPQISSCSAMEAFYFLPWISALQLVRIYKNVVGTETCAEQLSFAEKLLNIWYQQTSPAMTVDELKANVAPHQAIDLVTVAQAFHWFDCPTFYQQVKGLFKRLNGVLAVWCYTLPRINNSINAVLEHVCAESNPFWAPPHKMVDDAYRSLEFSFKPIEGIEHTSPFKFKAKHSMGDVIAIVRMKWEMQLLLLQCNMVLLMNLEYTT